eukprot:GEMP01076323.1.p2 GENE.GEMP01076323.1~~GEMP01076323.1.p2  ORF type:complete len:118 (+),score=22.91 GEMP01076323.1:198-551(+)
MQGLMGSNLGDCGLLPTRASSPRPSGLLKKKGWGTEAINDKSPSDIIDVFRYGTRNALSRAWKDARRRDEMRGETMPHMEAAFDSLIRVVEVEPAKRLNIDEVCALPWGKRCLLRQF